MAKKGILWTNKSALALADGQDPVAAAQAAARALVARALAEGWQGPPFNPVTLARMLNVQMEANGSIADARVFATDAGPKIEFNPQQPRERVRFTIAHELAHLLFPDWKDEIRNRENVRAGDHWQLEMLCNMAASEFVLPIGSLPSSDELPSIEELMIERRKYDVSAEAYINRLVRVCGAPVGAFLASPIKNSDARSYKIDYYIPSPTAPDLQLAGDVIPDSSAVKSCTAIGYTDRAIETWPTGQPTHIEFVGISAYPGDLYPRVAGLIRFDQRRPGRHPVKFVHGDVLTPIGDGPKIICQLVNDKAIKWGGGIARRAAQKYPNAELAFSDAIVKLDATKRLGSAIFTPIDDEIIIASLVAQHGFGPSLFPRIRYDALQKAMRQVAEHAQHAEASVHLPRLGTGAAGGEWYVVQEIVEDELVRQGRMVVVYDRPPKREQFELFS